MAGAATPLIWATYQHPEKPSEKLVLLALADFYNWETKQCNPRVEKIATWTGLSPRSVFDHLAALERQGYIRRITQRRSNGSQKSNTYLLPRMEEWAAAATDGSVNKSGDNYAGPRLV